MESAENTPENKIKNVARMTVPQRQLPPQRVGWLYIDFDSFFASVEQHLNPTLRGQPVAVVPVKSETTCAIAASYEAKAYGVKTGTPIWEARMRCPQLVLVHARHNHYVRMHEKIIELVGTHCLPIAAVCSIDEMACALKGSDGMPEKAIGLAQHIKSVLREHIGEAVRCSIGLAPNRFLAKVASAMEKPNGLTLLRPCDIPHKLLPLPPSDLPGIGRKMQHRLAAAGVHNMADLWALSPKQMRSIWHSVGGERFWRMLHGYDDAALLTERSSIGHSRVLDPDLRRVDAAHEIMRHLLIKAARRLREEGFVARLLWLGVRIEKSARFVDTYRMAPCSDTFVFLRAADALWQKMLAAHHPHFIKKISITLTDLLAHDETTGDLFDQAPKARPRTQLVQAVDRLHARYGSDAITYGWKGKKLDDFGTKVAFTRVPTLEEFDY